MRSRLSGRRRCSARAVQFAKQRVNLHAIMINKYCEFLETPLPSGVQIHGLENDIEVDSDGNVHASNKPGLGADIDIELIERNRFAIVF